MKWAAARWVLVVAIAGGLAALVVFARQEASRPLAPTPPPPLQKQNYNFTSNAQCKACHEDVYVQWTADEHSRAWFNKPLMPQDPKRTECTACHAPAPILEIGLDKPAVIRSGRYEEGVGCIECHQQFDHVRGPKPGKEAACNPTQDLAFKSVQICAPCHAPHGTIDEWKASDWGKKNHTCQDCHMPPGTHKMLTQRDPEFLNRAVSTRARVENGKLIVEITNDNTGHNFPGEIFNREAFLKVTVENPEGEVAASHRESFKTPPRPQRGSEVTTQIRAGETRRYEYPLEIPRGKVRLLLGYKLFVFNPDMGASRMWEQTIDF